MLISCVFVEIGVEEKREMMTDLSDEGTTCPGGGMTCPDEGTICPGEELQKRRTVLRWS